MTTLAICTTRNRVGRRDGDEFVRECARSAQLHDAYVPYYKRQRPGKRRRLAEQFIRSAGSLGGPVDCVAVFGHGGRSRLHCTGHARRHIRSLADALAVSLNPQGAVVILYTCLTGKRWGFADQLDRALERRGCVVRTYSHVSRGHTTFNPNVEDSGEGPRSRGVQLIPHGHTLRREWVRRLRDDQDFRLSFWKLTQAELKHELQQGVDHGH